MQSDERFASLDNGAVSTEDAYEIGWMASPAAWRTELQLSTDRHRFGSPFRSRGNFESVSITNLRYYRGHEERNAEMALRKQPSLPGSK